MFDRCWIQAHRKGCQCRVRHPRGALKGGEDETEAAVGGLGDRDGGHDGDDGSCL